MQQALNINGLTKFLQMQQETNLLSGLRNDSQDFEKLREQWRSEKLSERSKRGWKTRKNKNN